jgi:tRNA G18 (ribose-2'-O)-methylase SpoU
MAPTPRTIIPVSTIGDPRIAVYRNLKDRDLSREGNRFIAEGEFVVRRLLESDFRCDSVLLANRRAEEIAPLVPQDVPIFAGPSELVHQIVGFKFHAGVMAVGVRKPPLPLERLASTWTGSGVGDCPRPGDDNVTLVVCPEISNTENLGALVRIAAGFGATAMVLGQHSCDPFYRQSVRVSMGTIFRLPIVQSRDLLADLDALKRRWGVETIATVCHDEAEPLAMAKRTKRVAILFGNEARGLGDDYVAACDRRVTIPMQLGTDSLNVSVAAGVVMYHFTQTEGARASRP